MLLRAPDAEPVSCALTCETARVVDARRSVLTSQVRARVLGTLVHVHVTEGTLPGWRALAEEPIVAVYTSSSIPAGIGVAFVLCQKLLKRLHIVFQIRNPIPQSPEISVPIPVCSVT